MLGQWREWLLLSSPTARNRELRLMTAKQKKSDEVSYSNTLAEDWTKHGSTTVLLKSSLKTKVCWCSFLIFCWFLIYWLHKDNIVRYGGTCKTLYNKKIWCKNTFQMTMECASIFTENNESSPHCVSFKFKHFLSSPQSSLELSCFYYFFPSWMCIFNLKCPQYKTRPLFTTQMHNRASFMYSKTFWLLTGVYILKYCSFVLFIIGKYKYCWELFLWRC